jgi:hypothetical protein
MCKISIFGYSQYIYRLRNKKYMCYLFCFGLQWHYNSDLQVTYILKRLQEGYCPNSQYDEDIESMNGREAHAKRKRKIKIVTRFCNLPPEGARVDDQDGRSFGMLFLWQMCSKTPYLSPFLKARSSQGFFSLWCLLDFQKETKKKRVYYTTSQEFF